MKLKELLKMIGLVKKDKINNKFLVGDCPLDLGIYDDLLLVTLGQWMGMLSDCTKTVGSNFSMYTSLDAKDYLERFNIDYKTREAIQKRFAAILLKAGFTGEDIVVLENFDFENNTFKGNFYEKDIEPKFKIRFGTWLENGPELTVTNGDTVSLYNVWMGDENKEDNVELDYQVRTLNPADKKFARSYSKYSYRASVYDSLYNLDIHIEYPTTLADDYVINPNVDEELLESILTNVEFPVNIEELINNIRKALVLDADKYPSISISVLKAKNEKEKNVTDEAKFKYGEFISFKVTKNGKTISIDNFDSWTYKTNLYNITQSKDKNISYGFNGMPVDQFEEMPAPTELVKEANHEVDEVKGMVLKLLKK